MRRTDGRASRSSPICQVPHLNRHHRVRRSLAAAKPSPPSAPPRITVELRSLPQRQSCCDQVPHLGTHTTHTQRLLSRPDSGAQVPHLGLHLSIHAPEAGHRLETHPHAPEPDHQVPHLTSQHKRRDGPRRRRKPSPSTVDRGMAAAPQVTGTAPQPTARPTPTQGGALHRPTLDQFTPGQASTLRTEAGSLDFGPCSLRRNPRSLDFGPCSFGRNPRSLDIGPCSPPSKLSFAPSKPSKSRLCPPRPTTPGQRLRRPSPVHRRRPPHRAHTSDIPKARTTKCPTSDNVRDKSIGQGLSLSGS